VRFARAQKVLTFLLALVAAIPVVLSGEVSLVFGIGFVALAGAGWFFEPPLTRDRRYRRAMTAAILAILALQLGRALLGEPLARMGIEFALALLGIKLMSRGSSGDYQQIVILAFLHAIGATIATFDLSYAISFALFVVLSPPVLALAHLRNEMERRFRHDDRPESRRALGRLLASKRVVSPRFVVATSALSLPVFAITAVLFVGFPRLGLGFLGRLPGGAELGGFTEEVQIGDLDQTRREETVILRLEPVGDAAERPERLRTRLRGAAFDVYEGDTWKQSNRRKWERIREGGEKPGGSVSFPQGRVRSLSASTPGYEILLEPLEPPYLFVPEGTGVIVTPQVGQDGDLVQRELLINHLGIIQYKDDSKVGISYEVFVTGGPPPAPSLPDWTTGGAVVPGPDHATRVNPPGTERLAELAREIAPQGAPTEQAELLVRELKRRYRYADRLEVGEDMGQGRTPLDRFLFSRGSGTCEHFATALTLMLRAVGVPARLVTGFSSAEWNSIGGYYAVRLRSAHAWTEAYLDGSWIALDATPPSERAGPLTAPSTLAMLVDAIQMRWHKYIVGYDASSQQQIVEQFRRLWSGSGRGAVLPEVPGWAIWTLLGAVAAGLGIAWALRRHRSKRGRSAAARREQSAAAAEATRLFLALDRRLSSLGYERPVYLTPMEFARELGMADRGLAIAARRIVVRYNEVRFGSGQFDPGEPERLRGEIRELSPSVDGVFQWREGSPCATKRVRLHLM
jgi:transglutaminase-like putative cysteine protease